MELFEPPCAGLVLISEARWQRCYQKCYKSLYCRTDNMLQASWRAFGPAPRVTLKGGSFSHRRKWEPLMEGIIPIGRSRHSKAPEPRALHIRKTARAVREEAWQAGRRHLSVGVRVPRGKRRPEA